MDEIPTSKFYLNRNLRNTRAIHLCTKPWYKGRVTRCIGPEGVPVEWQVVTRREDMISGVKGALADLVRRQNVSPGDVAILSGARRDGHPLARDGAIAGFPFTSAGAAKRQLVFDTVRRFKGLERSVVLLIDIEEIKEPELIYVSLSRPSVLLKVFGTEDAITRFRSGEMNDD